MIQSFEPIKDTYMYEGFAYENYGKKHSLFIGRYNGLGTIFRSLLCFDLSSLPNNITIISAFLKLYVYRKDIDGVQKIYIYKLMKQFCENSVAWRKITYYDVQATRFYGEVSSIGEVSIDITGLVSEWMNTTRYNCGIEIRGTENKKALVGFRSREYSDSYKHPILVINYLQSSSSNQFYELGKNKSEIYPGYKKSIDNSLAKIELLDKVISAEQFKLIIDRGRKVNINIAKNIDLGKVPLVVNRKVIIDGGSNKNSIKGIIILDNKAQNSIFRNINMIGAIIINTSGGGSITFNNVTFKKETEFSGAITIISKEKNKLYLNGITLPSLNINSNSKITLGQFRGVPSSITNININAVSQKIKVPNLELHEGAYVTNLIVEQTAIGTSIICKSGVNIGNVVFNGRAKLSITEGNTNIDHIKTSPDAKESYIEVEEGAFLHNLDINGVEICVGSGEGYKISEIAAGI
jgi:hypothetical protein